MSLIRRYKRPHHPDPDPWIEELTNLAVGLQNVVIAARVEDVRIRGMLGKQGIEQVTAALNKLATHVFDSAQ